MSKMINFYTKQVIYFSLTGCISTLLMYSLYLGLKGYIGYQFAYALSYIFSVIALYFVNRLWVFNQSLSWRAFFRFCLLYLGQYVVGAMLLEFFVFLGISETIAPLIILVLLLPVTFLLSKKV